MSLSLFTRFPCGACLCVRAFLVPGGIEWLGSRHDGMVTWDSCALGDKSQYKMSYASPFYAAMANHEVLICTDLGGLVGGWVDEGARG